MARCVYVYYFTTNVLNPSENASFKLNCLLIPPCKGNKTIYEEEKKKIEILFEGVNDRISLKLATKDRARFFSVTTKTSILFSV